MKVPWLAKEEIAWKAFGLLADYESMVGKEVKPPIPVFEEIDPPCIQLPYPFKNFR